MLNKSICVKCYRKYLDSLTFGEQILAHKKEEYSISEVKHFIEDWENKNVCRCTHWDMAPYSSSVYYNLPTHWNPPHACPYKLEQLMENQDV